MSKPIDASKAKVGNAVTATVSEDVESGGRVVVSKGAKLVGRVAAARPLSRTKGSTDAKGDSELAIVFDRAEQKDGREVPLNATVQVGNSTGAVNATQQPPSNSASAREPVDRR